MYCLYDRQYILHNEHFICLSFKSVNTASHSSFTYKVRHQRSCSQRLRRSFQNKNGGCQIKRKHLTCVGVISPVGINSLILFTQIILKAVFHRLSEKANNINDKKPLWAFSFQDADWSSFPKHSSQQHVLDQG